VPHSSSHGLQATKQNKSKNYIQPSTQTETIRSSKRNQKVKQQTTSHSHPPGASGLSTPAAATLPAAALLGPPTAATATKPPTAQPTHLKLAKTAKMQLNTQ
jgi:hypothetical protein